MHCVDFWGYCKSVQWKDDLLVILYSSPDRTVLFFYVLTRAMNCEFLDLFFQSFNVNYLTLIEKTSVLWIQT